MSQSKAHHGVDPKNSKILAEIWGDFVGWYNRRKGEGNFLINALKKYECKKILDAASGDGVDTIYLLQQGFNVLSNDIDPAFRQKAIENARKDGLSITPTDLDWRELTKKYPEASLDAVICLGNSLTLLFGKENHLRALREFHTILKPGGILIIDERNYQKILDTAKEGIPYHASGKYVYTGLNKVEPKIVEINDSSWTLEYLHKKSGKKAYYTGYPFKRGEILGLLKEAGFSEIKVFGDYKSDYNADADYYQYVCIKH